MDLTILIPVKNEEDNIALIINKIESIKISFKYEILFINDYSDDNTIKEIEKYKRSRSNINLINNKKLGLGESVRNGIKYSKGIYLSIIMCDGSDDLDDLKKYIDLIKSENLDAVFGSRYLK